MNGAELTGVFRNPPAQVPRAFGRALEADDRGSLFREIVFAILPRRAEDVNLEAFHRVLEEPPEPQPMAACVRALE